MTTRHRHADVLIAIAEGKEVECRADENDEWELMNGAMTPLNDCYKDMEWRVKKEPVMTEIYFFAHQEWSVSEGKFVFKYVEFNPDLQQWDLKVTLADGKRIKAELPA